MASLIEQSRSDGDALRRDKTRQLLIDASFTVFAERGVQAVSVQELAAAAGFTRGAFYSNFSSKEELFFAVLQQESKALIDQLEIDIDDTVNAAPSEASLENVSGIVRTIFGGRSVDKRWRLVRMEWLQTALRDPLLAARQLELQRHMDRRIAHVLVDSMGRIGRRFTVDDLLAASAVQGVFDSVLTQLLLEGAPPLELADRLATPVATVMLALTEDALPA